MKQTPESLLKILVMDWLQAKHIFAIRFNTGASYFGKRFVQFATPGCADILACPAGRPATWLELKATHGKQSVEQKSFQRAVEESGHRYLIVRSLEEVITILD